MDCGQVLTKLRAHESELKEAGVAQLSLFGSTARGDASPNSDMDVLADLDKAKCLSLLDVVCIEVQLTDLLGVKVDLIVQGTLKPRVRQSVQRELLRAFQGTRASPSRQARRKGGLRSSAPRPADLALLASSPTFAKLRAFSSRTGCKHWPEGVCAAR
jgi:hypothetical protein